MHYIGLSFDLNVERLEGGGHFREAENVGDRGYGLLWFRGQFWAGR